MENTKRRVGLVRVAVAALFALLFLAILIPNTGRIVVDTSTTPPSYHIEDRRRQIATLLAMLVVPLVCICFGARRSRILEVFGWVLLVGLFILATQKGRI